MGKSSRKGTRRKELLDRGYVECYYCDELVKPRALKCPHCGRWYSTGKAALAAVLVAAVLLLALAYYYWPTGSPGAADTDAPTVVSTYPTGLDVSTGSQIRVTFSREMDRDSVESAFYIEPDVPGEFSWSSTTLEFDPSVSLQPGTVYTVGVGAGAVDVHGNGLDCGPYQWQFTTAGGTSTGTRRDIGTGEDDFWSRTTDHPSWVVSAVQSKPVMILTHSEGCQPCIIQTGICEALDAEYSGRIVYFDITSGVDEPQATDCFGAYDPDGPPNFIPLTTVLTMGPNNQIIWHSWEGVVDEATLSSWIDDAIEYHNIY